MHLLALLAGIYLMIFVVEPVAVPQQYLAQHYYGLPWSAQRRTNFPKGQMMHLPFIKNNIYQDFSKGQPQIDIHPARNFGSSNLTHKVEIHSSSVAHRLDSSSQNPRRKLYSSTHISQRKRIKKVIPLRHSLNPTATSNITQSSKGNGEVLWRPLRLNSQNGTETRRSEKKKVFNSAGSA
ncbi:hypothetical protein X975_13523, partial [Stegodyphus mimosarum]